MDSFGIPALEMDARNWTIWCRIVEEVINDHGLCHYLNGTATDPNPQLSALAKFIIVSSISDTLCWRVMECKTAFDMMSKLGQSLGKAMSTTSTALLPYKTACVAAQAQNPLYNPPDQLPSTSLEGGRIVPSNKLNKIRNDELKTMQPTWMPRDESPSGEVHGVVRGHEEAAGVDVEGGEAGERTCTGDDEECRACERIDDWEINMASQPVDDEATDTTNPHATCAGPTRSVGTSHNPADEPPGEREGVKKAKSVSMLIEGRSGRMATDRADEPRSLGDDLSDMLETPEGGGTDCGRGSGDIATKGASGGSQRVTLKLLAEEEVRQCLE
jgi:hypothetical protein